MLSIYRPIHSMYLPPTPTRRSSDLVRQQATGPRADRCTSAAPSRRRAGAGPRCRLGPPRGGGKVDQMDLTQALLDRKSTRLNSSHVAISYAVFCLKKKLMSQTTHRR